MELGIGAIGGKDSMSGSFESLDVPPTLVSFAVTTDKARNMVSPEFKAAGHRLFRLAPEYGEDGLPLASSLLALFDRVTELLRSGKAVSCYTPGPGGIAEAVLKMCLGNGFGFSFDAGLTVERLFSYDYGAFLLESVEEIPGAELLGTVTQEQSIRLGDELLSLRELTGLYEDRLESVYPCNIPAPTTPVETFTYQNAKPAAPVHLQARPRVLIPAFPGTNCEYDSAKAMADAGAEAQILVINNLSSEGIARSVESFAKAVRDAQMIFIPGGFSGGDEPDGSGKFIATTFRNPRVAEAVNELLKNRDGLMLGICNGFQALIKLGLVPYGEIRDLKPTDPTLTFNTVGRHISHMAYTRVTSVKSPWFSGVNAGDVFAIPVSHGEGRFMADEATVKALAANGQIATQYVDLSGKPSADIAFNVNGSVCAIEGITSPDGRVLGKMGHSERKGENLYKNVPFEKDQKIFESGVKYFK